MFNGAPAVTPALLLDWEEADGGEDKVGARSPQAAVAVVLLAEAEVALVPSLRHAAVVDQPQVDVDLVGAGPSITVSSVTNIVWTFYKANYIKDYIEASYVRETIHNPPTFAYNICI